MGNLRLGGRLFWIGWIKGRRIVLELLRRVGRERGISLIIHLSQVVKIIKLYDHLSFTFSLKINNKISHGHNNPINKNQHNPNPPKKTQHKK